MNNETAGAGYLQNRQVYLLAAICLLVGLAIGYLVRGSESHAAVSRIVPATAGTAAGARHSMDQLKSMADKKAAPLLEKLKTDPNNAAALVQLGGLYHSAHQFTQSATYYQRAVQVEPKNTAYRTKLAASLYRNGDVNGAITQLNHALADDPDDPNTLFNLGMIKFEGMEDTRGALAAWQQLLKTNPHLSKDRKAMVEKMMDHARAASTQASAKRSSEQ